MCFSMHRNSLGVPNLTQGRVAAGQIQPYVPEDRALWNSMPVHYGEEMEPLLDESEVEIAERRRWQEWARHAAEQERQRRVKVSEGSGIAVNGTRVVILYQVFIWPWPMFVNQIRGSNPIFNGQARIQVIVARAHAR